MRPYDINPPYQASAATFSTNAFPDPADTTAEHPFNGNIDVPSPFYSPPSVTDLSLSATASPTSPSSSTADKESPVKAHCCPVHQCQRKFKRLEHLKRHMRIHTMERPFACTSCNKTFSRSDNLSQHQKTHTRPSPSTKPDSSNFMHHQQDSIWPSSMKTMEYWKKTVHAWIVLNSVTPFLETRRLARFSPYPFFMSFFFLYHFALSLLFDSIHPTLPLQTICFCFTSLYLLTLQEISPFMFFFFAFYNLFFMHESPHPPPSIPPPFFQLYVHTLPNNDLINF